ncbi:MAG TPA: hypothetical protein DHU79_05775 [Clostridiales bacterium]|nr:hypothetical protein [Clostridiales bacterium]
MTEAQKILYAKNYIDKMANGQNPLTDEALPDDDLLNNVKITRCLFFVSSLLQELVDLKSGPQTTEQKHTYNKPKTTFEATKEMIDGFPYDNTHEMYIKQVVDYFNAFAEANGMRKVYTTAVLDWLTKNEYLLDVTTDGENHKAVSGLGKQYGVFSQLRKDSEGKCYSLITLNESAQRLVAEHINEIAAEQKFDKKYLSYGHRTPYNRTPYKY